MVILAFRANATTALATAKASLEEAVASSWAALKAAVVVAPPAPQDTAAAVTDTATAAPGAGDSSGEVDAVPKAVAEPQKPYQVAPHCFSHSIHGFSR